MYAMMKIRHRHQRAALQGRHPTRAVPWSIGDVLGYLPFAAMASAPCTSTPALTTPLLLLALQAVWAALLWPLAHLLWSRSREPLVTHGG